MRELTHVGVQCEFSADLNHVRDIFGSLIWSEQILLGEKHFSYEMCMYVFCATFAFTGSTWVT